MKDVNHLNDRLSSVWPILIGRLGYRKASRTCFRFAAFSPVNLISGPVLLAYAVLSGNLW